MIGRDSLRGNSSEREVRDRFFPYITMPPGESLLLGLSSHDWRPRLSKFKSLNINKDLVISWKLKKNSSVKMWFLSYNKISRNQVVRYEESCNLVG